MGHLGVASGLRAKKAHPHIQEEEKKKVGNGNIGKDF